MAEYFPTRVQNPRADEILLFKSIFVRMGCEQSVRSQDPRLQDHNVEAEGIQVGPDDDCRYDNI